MKIVAIVYMGTAWVKVSKPCAQLAASRGMLVVWLPNRDSSGERLIA